MKRGYAFLLAVCLMLSGCGQGSKSQEKETTGEAAEQITEIETESETEEETEKEPEEREETETEPAETEETETQPEPMVTICTGIDSRIVKKDENFSNIQKLDTYLTAKEVSLINLNFVDENSNQPRLFKGDEEKDWTEEDWDLVNPLEQATTGDMGYGKIDYNNDGKKDYIYRIIEGESFTATGYEVSEDGQRITGDYDLQELFRQEYEEESKPRHLWFLDMDGTVVSFSMVKNTENLFRIYAFLVEGDTVSVLEERELNIGTKRVPESEAESEENVNAMQPLDFTGEDPKAYDLSWEELKSLRRERDVKKAEQETELPRELAELLQDILIRQLSESSFTEEFSVEDCLEPYMAKDCQVDEEGVKNFLGDSMPYDSYTENLRKAYIADLDGDGKEEMVVLTRTDGTIGYRFFDIWRQKEDSADVFWKERYTYFFSYTGLLFIGGHYYYEAELIDDSSGEYEGFLVFSFLEDGTVKLDKVTIESQEDGKIWKKLYENETMDSASLDSIQSYIESKKSEIENNEVWKGEVEIPYEESEYDFSLEAFNLYGDASDCTLVDFDNDGELECCSKKLEFGSTTWPQLAEAILKKEGSYVRRLEIDFPGYGFPDHFYCLPWDMWFEQFNGQNYIFRMTRISGSSDYFLTVQVIRDRKLYPVMNYLLLDKKVCKYEKADPEYYINFH